MPVFHFLDIQAVPGWPFSAPESFFTHVRVRPDPLAPLRNTHHIARTPSAESQAFLELVALWVFDHWLRCPIIPTPSIGTAVRSSVELRKRVQPAWHVLTSLAIPLTLTAKGDSVCLHHSSDCSRGFHLHVQNISFTSIRARFALSSQPII